MRITFLHWLVGLLFSSTWLACNQEHTSVSLASIGEIDLKRGDVISCGNSDKQFGDLTFETSCKGKVKEDFNTAIKLLHSFEYDEAEKVFAKIIDVEPTCAMAYWGVAMANFHPLWSPATPAELKKGNKAIDIARSITKKSQREADYIEAIAAYYEAWDKVDHLTRCRNFETAMKKLYTTYPADKEAAIFYALALNAAADPTDKLYTKQKQAVAILNGIYAKHPNHPGIVHYIIHSYDSPELAHLALPAARKYASVAPSSAHALHMPSHIFTRLGLWEEAIESNRASVYSAKCYAEAAGIKGHWDEELHGMDYMVYAYLQRGDNKGAKEQWDYLQTIHEVYPANFKVAYASAAIPSRYLLENKLWQQAADLQPHQSNVNWQQFPWEKAIIHFTRLLGNVQTNQVAAAKAELNELKVLQAKLQKQKETFKANKVGIQVNAAAAWIAFKEGKNEEAIRLLTLAADLEDKTGKHPVTPGDVIPARELLGELLLQMNKPQDALQAFEASLKQFPHRFNGVYGAGRAAEQTGDRKKAKRYYSELLVVANSATSNRSELVVARQFVNRQDMTAALP